MATGKVVFPTIQNTWTEADFLAHSQQLVESDPEGQWIFIADPLNTHKSASLVTWIAEQCAVKDDLGKKGTAGILQDMPQELRFCRMKATEFDLFIRRSIAHGSIRLKSGLAQVTPFAQFKSTDELKRTTFEVYCVFQRNAG